jgi:two-component system, response regulator YesN
MAMYKVLIADDEWMNREGLAQSIPWDELECQVAGLAVNGLDCIEQIDAIKPDILITDIKMPGKNGLEASEYALSQNPDTIAILLSGYNDFEYARKAVELGAFNYILKPTVYEDVVDCIKKAVATLRKKEELSQFREAFQRQKQFYKKAFLQQLMMKPAVDSARIKDSLALYSLPEEGPYTLLLIKLDRYESLRQHSAEEDLQILLMALEHRLNSCLAAYLKEDGVVPLKDGLYGALLREDTESGQERITEICETLQGTVKQHFGNLTISIGVGKAKGRITELYLAYVEASDALQHILYLGGDAVIFSDSLKSMNQSPEESSLLYAETVKEIVKLLRSGNESEALEQVRLLFELFDYYKEHPDTVKRVCMETGAQIGGVASSLGTEAVGGGSESIYSGLLHCETSEEYSNTLSQAVHNIATEVYKKTRTSHKRAVRQVLELVESNFQQYDISLQWVSNQIHMNSSYVSRLIKNECGETFTQLLNRIRLEKAKQLLQDPNVKIYEVSEKTGFTDSQYFASKFKKHTGMTPSEYRDHFIDMFH